MTKDNPKSEARNVAGAVAPLTPNALNQTPGTAPEARKEKLQHLSRLINERKYYVDPEDVAEKIMDFYLVGPGEMFSTIH